MLAGIAAEQVANEQLPVLPGKAGYAHKAAHGWFVNGAPFFFRSSTNVLGMHCQADACTPW